MATWTNRSKNLATQTLTWDQATFAWQNAGEDTWDTQSIYTQQLRNTTSYTNQSKNTAAFTNITKH